MCTKTKTFWAFCIARRSSFLSSLRWRASITLQAPQVWRDRGRHCPPFLRCASCAHHHKVETVEEEKPSLKAIKDTKEATVHLSTFPTAAYRNCLLRRQRNRRSANNHLWLGQKMDEQDVHRSGSLSLLMITALLKFLRAEKAALPEICRIMIIFRACTHRSTLTLLMCSRRSQFNFQTPPILNLTQILDDW